jgi:mevalonate kinase
VDTAAMRHPTDNRKRGLGSSAAAAAAAAGAASLAAGLDPADKATRALLAEAATEAHIAHQGGIGSGADVAACVHGGVIRFARGEGATAVEPAAAIPWAVVEVGPGGASSVEMVRAVMASDPRRRGRSMLELAEAASEAAAAYAIGRTTRFLQWIEAFRDACDRLGTDAGVPIVTAKDRRLAEIARRHGGAAKPSGAGGGELAIVFAPSDPALEAILAAATEAGAPGASGVEPDSQGLRRAR